MCRTSNFFLYAQIWKSIFCMSSDSYPLITTLELSMSDLVSTSELSEEGNTDGSSQADHAELSVEADNEQSDSPQQSDGEEASAGGSALLEVLQYILQGNAAGNVSCRPYLFV